jgi:ABC-2 type transport system ATP-binding protein
MSVHPITPLGNGTRTGVPGPVLEVSHLSRSYGAAVVVDDVSFTMGKGEIVGLLGANGAGKTTTIMMLLGLVEPTAGAIRILGQGFDRDRESILAGMNFCAPYLSFPGRLSIHENLMVFARLYEVPQPEKKVAGLLRQFDLEAMKDRPVRRLSSGQNTRVALCKALLNDPRLLLLDEPTAYLDPQVCGMVKDQLRRLRDETGTSILYTTHNMAEAEEMCGRILFLAKGRLVAQGTPLEVTHALVDHTRTAPSLREVFLRLASMPS